MSISDLVRGLARRLPRSRPGSPPRTVPAAGDAAGWSLVDAFHVFFDAVPDAAGIADLEGRLLAVNDQAARLYGYASPEQVIAEVKTYLSLVVPSDRPRALAELARILQVGNGGPVEFDFVRRDGTTFPVELSGALVNGPEGKPIGIVGVTRDVSARKQAQTMLREYADKLTIMAESAVDLATASPEAAYRILASRLQELADALVVAVLTYDPTTNAATIKAVTGLDRFRPLLQRLLGDDPAGGAYTPSGEALQRLKTGRLHDVPGFYALMFGRASEQASETIEQIMGIGTIHSIGLVKDEQIMGMASIIMPKGRSIAFPAMVETLARQSTTQLLRQIAEQSVRDSEQRFRTLFQEIGDGFVLLDAALNVVDCHDTPQGLLGFHQESMIGQSLDVACPGLLRGEPTLMDELRQVLQTGKMRACTGVRYAVDESKRPALYLDLIAYAVRIGGQPSVALLCRDVSARIALDAALHNAQRQAIFSRMASGVAHDLGGLLAVIRAAGEVVEASLAEGTPEQEEMKHIQSAVDRGDALRRQMLRLARPESVPFEILDLNHVVQDASSLLRAIAGGGIDLQFRRSAEDIFLWGDEGQIVRILLNLTDNARDAMPHGGSLIIETRMESLEAERAQAWQMEATRCAVLSVSDTGEGISKESLARICEPFFSTKNRGQHSGLGLSSVAEIVKAHNGHVEVQSTVGVGSTFSIYLPAIDVSDMDLEQ